MTSLERRILAERLLKIAGANATEYVIKKIEEELEQHEL